MQRVKVYFDPERSCRQVKKSYVLSADGFDDVLLPVATTELELVDTPVGKLVFAANIPHFIAVDRGLVEENDDDDSTETISFWKWCLLGATMAHLIRGDSITDAVWEARKVADRISEIVE